MNRRWDVLRHIVKENGLIRGAEIGVWKGQTFFHLLDHCPHLFLVGVDQWKSWPKQDKDIEKGISSWKSQEEMNRHCEYVKATAKAYGNRATILHMSSEEAARLVQDLDFVFIDADHSTEGVLNDIRLWSPKVRPDGFVVGHDAQWPSVNRALRQSFDSWDLHEDNVWSVKV